MFRETDEVREPIWRGIVIKALFLGAFVLLLLWLFPMPKVEPLLDNLFNENIQTMKEAAKNYYTNERLPKTLGSKTSMTLNEMLTKKLLLPFVDGNGEQCDLNASYVEITKMETEYILKAFLSCNSRTDYIIEHLGCHDLCKTEECICDCDTAIEEPEKPNKPKRPEKTVKITEYQIQKTTKSESWSNWGAWTFDYKSETSNLKRDHRYVYTAKKWVETSGTQYEYKTVTTTTTEGTTTWVTGSWTKTKETESQYNVLVGTKVVSEPTGQYSCSSSLSRTVILPLGQVPSYTSKECNPKKSSLVDCSSGICTKWNIYKKNVPVMQSVTYYQYKKGTYHPGTSSSNTKYEWVTSKSLYVGTKKTSTNVSVTTSYTGKTKSVSNNDGHYEAEQPVKYYTQVNEIKSPYVKDKTLSQYRYKTRTVNSGTVTKWVSKKQLDKYLKDGWKVIKTRTKTIKA